MEMVLVIEKKLAMIITIECTMISIVYVLTESQLNNLIKLFGSIPTTIQLALVQRWPLTITCALIKANDCLLSSISHLW